MSVVFGKETDRPRALAVEGGLKMIKYGEFVDLKEVDIWLQKNAEWIKGKLPAIPHTGIDTKILDEDNILSGKTRSDGRFSPQVWEVWKEAQESEVIRLQKMLEHKLTGKKERM